VKVEVTKSEGKKPYVQITADEIAYDTFSIDEWIRHLRLAKAWLARRTLK
jgi:hypothetical protein